MTTLRTGSGKAIRTTSLLGRGGEGVVFNVDAAGDIAAKLYTDGGQLKRRDKVSMMVAAELHKRTGLVAYPIDTLVENTGDFVGFTMRKIGGVKPIHELYAPGSRKIEFPKADFRFLARTATNVARAVGSVHQFGCVIGDINHSGFLVSDQATATLIDADSFQVRAGTMTYRCFKGVGEYTPPELQGLPLETVDREPWHDAFGLAVIIFQLLFMGRHPFAGRFSGQGDMPIEKAIKEGRFAYSVLRKSETRMDPPPFVPTLADVTVKAATAFERAFFANPAEYRNRPTPAEWVQILSQFESDLIPCGVNRAHHRLKNSRTCPWCTLEAGMGVSLFPFPDIGPGDPPAPAFDLNGALAAINRVAGPGQAPDPATVIPAITRLAKSAAAQQARQGKTMRLVGAFLVAAAALGGIAFAGGASV